MRLEDSFSSDKLLSLDTILLANTDVAEDGCEENGKCLSGVLNSCLGRDGRNDVGGAGILSRC